jgi:hypothetical protein
MTTLLTALHDRGLKDATLHVHGVLRVVVVIQTYKKKKTRSKTRSSSDTRVSE